MARRQTQIHANFWRAFPTMDLFSSIHVRGFKPKVRLS
jgi:hypothetical protein